mgnify:CR=1 FL=1
MLIVMDNGYATRPSEQTPFPTTVFEEVLMQEVIPMIDEKFRTLPNRESRAIAGLSMGANQTMRIAMNHPEAFAIMVVLAVHPTIRVRNLWMLILFRWKI